VVVVVNHVKRRKKWDYEFGYGGRERYGIVSLVMEEERD
jgi:hypothetical protein